MINEAVLKMYLLFEALPRVHNHYGVLELTVDVSDIILDRMKVLS